MIDDESLDGLKGDDRIIQQAKQRFNRCRDWEATSRGRFIADYKFANGDPDNFYQWPNAQWSSRADDPDGAKPRLTINKTRQHNLQIINDAKQNKPGVNIRPTGGEATYDAAQVFEGTVRYIERISRAEQAYDTATSFQVQAGVGYFRVVTDYAGDDTFDQEIFIRRVKDPMSVYLDPDINEVDGSDARFGFVYEDMPKDEFRTRYPEFYHEVGPSPLGDDDGWLDQDHIRVAEYFVKEIKKDRLLSYIDPETGDRVSIRRSNLPKEIYAALKEDKESKERTIEVPQIMWYKIAGHKIIDRTPWLGAYIPICRVIGEETIIEGQLDRKGHTRALKDAQRMYNYWSSAAVEQVAFQTKSPWLIPVGSTDNLESYWNTLNTTTPAYIPYNAVNDDGQPLAPPQRADPPVMAEAFIKGMAISQQELMMASGQYEANMGQKSNEVSGKAISERQRQGDTATYHFIDGLAIAIRYLGVILIDLIPKIYDTPRILRILAEDGTESRVQLDPMSKQAYVAGKPAGEEEAEVLAIFNPSIGRYAVESDVGPSYSTKRQEAWNAFTQIVAQNQQLVMVIGDLMFRNADFPGADEIAERLKRNIPPHLLGEAPPPSMQMLQQQNENLQTLLAELMQKLSAKERQLQDKTREESRLDYEAESKRITAVSNAQPELGPDTIAPVVIQTIEQMIRDGEPGEAEEPMEMAQ